MAQKPRVGESWGALVLYDKVYEMKTETDGAVTDTYRHTIWKFKCACGKKFDFDEDEFMGRRELQDCGCGIAAKSGKLVSSVVRQGRPPATEPHLIATFYISLDMYKFICERAAATHVAKSKTVMELLGIGRQVVE
jgi:hypothetical protein